jgi:hypothetical protein
MLLVLCFVSFHHEDYATALLCMYLSTYSAACSSLLRNFLTLKFLSDEFVKITYSPPSSRYNALSHVHCVPKKGGITVVPNDKNELIPQRILTGYRMVIDFRKLNKASRKDHYPLPFIDQMLERISKHTLLLLRWLFWFFSNTRVTTRSRENHFYLSFWNLCL